jgi:multimeric flavodoxin WrbA
MKVLGIVGSTRKNGNTQVLVQEVLDAAAKEGAETEMIFLSEFQLSPCNACHVCDRTTPPICTIKDDVEKLTKLVVKADGFIIGSPVYYGGVTSEVKIFIDRIGYLNRARERTTFRNKIGGAVAVARRTGLTGTLDQLTGFLSSMNMILPGSARVRGIGNKRGEVRKDEEGIREARMLGSEMVTLMRLTKELR